jgi:arylsulfatase A-like enzyme
VFAFAAATVIACFDTFFGIKKVSEYLPALAIATGAWLLPALVIALTALVVRLVVVRTKPLRRILLPTASRMPGHLSAVILAAVGAWILDFAFGYALRGNVVTQRIAIVLVVFAYVVLAGLIYPRLASVLTWILDRLPSFVSHPSVFLGSLVLLGIIGLIAGRTVEPEYFREVGWQTPAALAAVFLVAIVGTVAPRWLLWVATVVAGLGFGIAIWSFTTTHSADVYENVRQRTHVTPWLLMVTSRPRHRAAVDMPDDVQACRPNETITPPERIGAAPEDAPDIVLVTIDGWRWDHSSMDGSSDHDVTPQIARHARRAAVFERAYPPAASTRQSFRGMFTSIINGRVGGPHSPDHRWALTLVEGQPTLAGYLEAAGYETVALVSDPGAFPEDMHGLDGFAEIDDRYITFRRQHGYVATFAMNHIMERLSRPPEAGSPPRFVWVHLNETHFPFSYGPELPTAQRLPYHQRHLHSLRYADQQVGRLLDYLAGRERKDKTWVFITSDHGEQFDEHGGRRHGSMIYEEEIHVPLLVWGPGVRAGRRSTPVSLVDLMPTILDAAGLQQPTGLCGESLMESLKSGAEPERGPVYVAALPDETREWFKVAWIDGDRKLIISPDTGRFEVYELNTDPDERENLAEDRPELTNELAAGLREFYLDHGLDPSQYALEP